MYLSIYPEQNISKVFYWILLVFLIVTKKLFRKTRNKSNEFFLHSGKPSAELNFRWLNINWGRHIFMLISLIHQKMLSEKSR